MAAKKKNKADTVASRELWHDGQGYFKKGNPGGPGRPFVRQARFLETLVNETSPDVWKEIVATAIKQAIDGDYRAREWLSKWLMGEPESVTPDQKSTIIDVLTDGSFVKWIESGGRNGTDKTKGDA